MWNPDDPILAELADDYLNDFSSPSNVSTKESYGEDPANLMGDFSGSVNNNWSSSPNIDNIHICFYCSEIFEDEIGWCSSCQKLSSCGYNYTFCQVSNCSERIAVKEKYCAKHSTNSCSVDYCCERIPKEIRYCSSHTPKYCATNGCYQRTGLFKYCGNCEVQQKQQRQQEKVQAEKASEQTRLKSLVKANTSITSIIKEVERFSTDWNKNLATVVASDGNYWVFLLVLDSENNSVKVFPVSADCQWWGEHSRGSHNYLSDANSEANWLQNKLKYDSNPILVIHPRCDSYTGFNSLVSSPYVKIDYNASISDFKPLDIVWVRRLNNYHHAGVYVGNGELIEFTNAGWHNVINGGGETRKRASWSDFLSDNGLVSQEIYRFHPIIPFKKYQEIIGQLVWAKDNGFWKGFYNTANRNCQHFSNMAVLGINYSQEIENKKELLELKNVGHAAARGVRTGIGTAATVAGIAAAPFTFGLSLIPAAITGASTVVGVVDCVEKCERGDFKINNGKGSTIKLTNEISESNNILGKKSDFETEKYERQYLQEVPTYISTNNCRIM